MNSKEKSNNRPIEIRRTAVDVFLLSMSRFSALVFALLLLSSHGHAESHSPMAIEPFNQGVKLFNAQRYADALPYFDRALSHDSFFAEAFYARGACQHALHHPSEAIANFNRAIELNPRLIDAITLRGVVAYETQQYESALRDFDYVLDQNPQEPQSLLGRGAIYIQNNELEKAEKDFRLFLKVRPNDPMAPRVRKVLASFKQVGGDESAETEIPSEPVAASAASTPVKRKAVRQVTPAMKQMTSELLFKSHPTAEAAAKNALRGQSTPVTGQSPTDR